MAHGRKGFRFLGALPLFLARYNYEKYKTDEVESSEQAWTDTHSAEAFRMWMFHALYLPVESQGAARKRILSDQVSVQTFLSLRPAWVPQASFTESLKGLSIPKVLISGENDRLLPPLLLEKEARDVGFEYALIEEASHFVTLDQPEAVARLIEEKFGDGHGEKQ